MFRSFDCSEKFLVVKNFLDDIWLGGFELTNKPLSRNPCIFMMFFQHTNRKMDNMHSLTNPRYPGISCLGVTKLRRR